MSHMIDTSNNRDNIAFVGEKPWHGLGAELQPGQTIEAWRQAAGLGWKVLEAKPWYEVPGQSACAEFEGRKVLFRSDTHAPLSVMSDGFNVVQPSQVLDLYGEIAKAGGFELETAGCLSGGKRIWALGRVGEGADVVNRDRVRPYILLATSFDGSMATVAKFTAVRVVCHNTISMAIAQSGESATSQAEKDDTASGKEQVVRVLHAVKWTDKVAEDVRLKLGIVHNSYERFMVESRALAARPMAPKEADDFVAFLLEPYYGGTNSKGEQKDVRETKGYNRILELFRGQAKGADMAKQTRWGMLNAVTELVDHERGRSVGTRLESAWFGTGNAIKDRAYRILNGEFSRVEDKLAA